MNECRVHRPQSGLWCITGQAARPGRKDQTGTPHLSGPCGICILDFMLYSPSCPGRGCSHSCDTDEETQGGIHPLLWPPPAPPPPHPHPSPGQGDQTHGLSASPVQMSFLSQPQRKLTPSWGLSTPGLSRPCEKPPAWGRGTKTWQQVGGLGAGVSLCASQPGSEGDTG